MLSATPTKDLAPRLTTFREYTIFGPLSSLAPVAREATGSLRQEAIVSQKLFCDPVAVFA